MPRICYFEVSNFPEDKTKFDIVPAPATFKTLLTVIHYKKLIKNPMFDTILNNPESLGQVIGAIIGVAGLVVGTFITILTSLIIRHMDVKREERKEAADLEKSKKEKAFILKQEIYSDFISELASLENFLTKKNASPGLKTLDTFDNEWTKIEIKVDLVASDKVRELKNLLSEELMNLAKEKFAQKDLSREISLSAAYTGNRTSLLEAIREDMEISPQSK